MDFPVLCACGNIVTFSNETRCEDCFALDMSRLKIKSTRPYAERGTPPEPDNTYEKLIERDNENEPFREKLLRSGRYQAR